VSCHLRFTPAEYQTICRALEGIALSDDFFAVFKYFLVEALLDSAPRLAGRLALMSRSKTRLLFNHLRRRKRFAA
jgi:hypothetical protein